MSEEQSTELTYDERMHLLAEVWGPFEVDNSPSTGHDEEERGR